MIKQQTYKLTKRKPRTIIFSIIDKHKVKKELTAFRSLIGMWENKDTSFFDKK
ncbi:hypothetical protein Dtox_3687 [Desulfofarcimen acetoxidans DSM 771]|uniref:Uncharacterized protein n=1 Tax=Desulfofarcimen acetoxidans (strain ATCC 49208 / DSM 771 / KCTC 5769 / VKM B-1644 / 5575) TaxID=485916 RepID=C8VWN2_DESAS|nr:hypothetical protein [Desulfofarcimen acetoxidans]ACV64396.1 hypothetical protein Dtox_3687 [Desulfofarcimen acetoxidans DSM 771]